MLVALVRDAEVREVGGERAIVVIHAVAEQVVRRAVAVAAAERSDQRAHHRPVAAREGAQVDVGDVVLEPPAVREPREVAGQRAEPVARADRALGGMPVLRRSRSAFARP